MWAGDTFNWLSELNNTHAVGYGVHPLGGNWGLELLEVKQHYVVISQYTALRDKDPNSKLNVQFA